jgi:hypothetical protein
MILTRLFARSRRYNKRARLRGAAPSMILASAGLALAGCASAGTFNPDNLRLSQIGRVVDICQSVVGYHSYDPPSSVWGAATDPRLEPGENDYQGCVASLSDSMKQVDDARGDAASDVDCRRQGYRSGSPGLAECVLHAREAGDQHARAEETSYGSSRSDYPEDTHKSDSIFGPSPAEMDRREQLACAKVGLSPTDAAFDNCVKKMKDTFYAIDNPQN